MTPTDLSIWIGELETAQGVLRDALAAAIRQDYPHARDLLNDIDGILARLIRAGTAEREESC